MGYVLDGNALLERIEVGFSEARFKAETLGATVPSLEAVGTGVVVEARAEEGSMDLLGSILSVGFIYLVGTELNTGSDEKLTDGVISVGTGDTVGL